MMKRNLLAIGLASTLLMPVVSWAGNALAPHPAPAVDESGLMLLAAGLVGAGVALLRRRGR